MTISAAIEALLPGERANLFTLSRERYGRSLQLVLRGRRLILDLVRR